MVAIASVCTEWHSAILPWNYVPQLGILSAALPTVLDSKRCETEMPTMYYRG